jgi:hypothetical protein
MSQVRAHRRKAPPQRPWCAWCGKPLADDQNTFCNEKCADHYTTDLWRQLQQRKTMAQKAVR